MSEIYTVEAKSQDRTDLAEMMAKFEAQNGEVKTSPIYKGERPKQTFYIKVPDQPKSKAPVKCKAAAERKPRANMLAKQKKLEAIRDLAITGISINEIFERIDPALGMTRKYIASAILNGGINRGAGDAQTK